MSHDPNHTHGPSCGHTAVQHDGHVDYLVDGELHHPTPNGCVVHALAANDACTSGHECTGHDASHQHGPGFGHEPVRHGDHVDYLVDGHLHHPHGDHCDDHGPLRAV
ncbi:MAG: hypothetical protein AAF602_31465, partial [Myxococcota bacterium]